MVRTILVSGTLPEVQRTDFTTETGVYVVDATRWRIHDNMSSLLPAAASGNDMALDDGAFGTNTPVLKSADRATSGGAQSDYARCMFAMPPEFVNGGAIQVRVHARMETVSDTSAVVDVEIYETNKEGGLGSDLVTTAATSINSATWADVNFTVDGTSVAPGELLDVRLTTTINDVATGSGVIAAVGQVEFRIGVRG